MFCQTKMLVYIVNKITFLTICCAFLSDSCTTMSANAMKKSKENRTLHDCEPLPPSVLTQIHGPAFDKRFMSIDEPTDDGDIMDSLDKGNRKRAAEEDSFYITQDYTEVLSEVPAWDIDWDKLRKGIPIRKKRSYQQKRANKEPPAPWKCEKRFKWIHLGPDYYPSHLRTVECTQSKCYYEMYDCEPKKFTVRILQRRTGACSDERENAKLKSYGFKGKVAEVWEFVSHTVNFCCDCVKRPDSHRYG